LLEMMRAHHLFTKSEFSEVAPALITVPARLCFATQGGG
jgi:hypothetical protein